MGCPALQRNITRARSKVGFAQNVVDMFKEKFSVFQQSSFGRLMKRSLDSAVDSRAYMLATSSWATPLPGWGGLKDKAALFGQALSGRWKKQQFSDYLEIMRYANEHNISLETSGYYMW